MEETTKKRKSDETEDSAYLEIFHFFLIFFFGAQLKRELGACSVQMKESIAGWPSIKKEWIQMHIVPYKNNTHNALCWDLNPRPFACEACALTLAPERLRYQSRKNNILEHHTSFVPFILSPVYPSLSLTQIIHSQK